MKSRPRCTRDADLWHMHAIDHIADPLSSTDDDGRPELSAPTLIRCMPSRDMYRVEEDLVLMPSRDRTGGHSYTGRCGCEM